MKQEARSFMAEQFTIILLSFYRTSDCKNEKRRSNSFFKRGKKDIIKAYEHE